MTSSLRNGAVHLARLVLEDTKLHDAACQHLRIFIGVFFPDTDKNQYAVANARMLLAFDNDARAGHALDDGSHQV